MCTRIVSLYHFSKNLSGKSQEKKRLTKLKKYYDNNLHRMTKNSGHTAQAQMKKLLQAIAH